MKLKKKKLINQSTSLYMDLNKCINVKNVSKNVRDNFFISMVKPIVQRIWGA
jgi:hypothetical protein